MKKLTSGRSAFLFELAILLMLFIVAMVICVSLFIFSNSRNTDANDLSSATLRAVSVADTLKACGTDLSRAKELLGADKDFQIFYDEDWAPGKGRSYRASVDCQIQGQLLIASIRFTRSKDGKLLYCLDTKEFLGEAL